jgi:hypothetical protein
MSHLQWSGSSSPENLDKQLPTDAMWKPWTAKTSAHPGGSLKSPTFDTGNCGRLLLKCDGTRAETRFGLSAKRTSPFKSAGASVQSTTGRRAVHISLLDLYCSCKPVFSSHVTLTGYPLHSLVPSSLLPPCVTVCQHISKATVTPLDVLTSKRRTPVKKYVGLSAVVSCVRDLPLLFSVVFNLVGAVFQYVFEHVVTWTV